MRLDKFLKNSRIIKRRTVSKQVADSQRVLINDKLAKPASTVAINDIITITFGDKTFKVKVLSLIDKPLKNDAETMYEIVSD